MKEFLWWIWQLPQHVLAYFLMLYFSITGGFSRRRYTGMYGVILFWVKKPIGISLGEYIFLYEGNHDNPEVQWHEYGHTIQSRMLGPLYLIVVGLPSITMNILSRWKVIDPTRYYERWPESWADRLGAIKKE
jgi:hypothetical protein